MAFNSESNFTRAETGWGKPLPEWVRLLAAACDQSSQRDVAGKLGKSSAYVSRLISRTYTGDMAEAESLVRATYGSETVNCPVAGDIPLAGCRTNRRRKGAAVNLVHRLWARNCPTCPINTDRSEA
ncbi:helix-turn-helix domain-containing protein [Sphingomonas sp. SRS2]|uniref:helix-turn-helix domain-containing protein n=1 Tax=Sphingomonas sp. SRS2 TaxID=133190 RepID=UPI0006184773|nr:helix-turn-helix transcriptional regulator [Sphingomonas sp. SRS2]KKC27425.1 hypothetical protein WP12_03335 [Sphingomonas sp. SRS2]